MEISAPCPSPELTDIESADRVELMAKEPADWEIGPCPIRNLRECTWNGRYQALYDHIITNHKEDVVIVDTNEQATFIWRNYYEKCNDDCSFRVLLKSHGELFLFTAETRERVTRIQINFFGDPETVERYSCEATVLDAPEKVFRLNLKMLCAWSPERETAINEEYALSIFALLLKTYCVNNDLRFCLNIKKDESRVL